MTPKGAQRGRLDEIELEHDGVERAAVDLLTAKGSLEVSRFDGARSAKLLEQLTHADLTT